MDDVASFGAAALTVNGNDRDLDIASDGSRIVYVGNNGTQLFVRALESLDPVAVFSGMPRGPFISPDGQWIGFWEDTGLIKVKMTGGPAVSLTRLEGEGPRGAAWGPDDTIIAATYGSAAGLRRMAATGGSTTVLTSPDHAQGEVDHLWPSDVMLMTLDEKRRVTPLVNSTFNEKNGIVSPDGRWLAYDANDSGQYEIWVRPFPNANSEKWQVTTTGGTRPLWSPNGQELFYVSPTGAVMRVGVERGPSWAVTTPTVAVKQGHFTTQGGFPARSYDITRDGQKFLMIKTTGVSDRSTAPARLVVVQNWVQELERLVPN